ncbi:MAG TPA: RING finger protein, partial [Pirellulaceae bacterium]|nr:RING finger protein [Pirellulaceae bacterium]
AGNSREQVRELLTAEVQTIIYRLTRIGGANFFGTPNIQVKWLGGAMTVTKPQHLSSYEDLDAFIQLSADLFVAALNSRTTGITFVSESVKIAEPDEGESQCQVCGEPLTTDLVFCSACKTPHHRECWEYFGGCSTYACGNKKYLVRSKGKAKK